MQITEFRVNRFQIHVSWHLDQTIHNETKHSEDRAERSVKSLCPHPLELMQVLCEEKVGKHTAIAISVGLPVRRYEYLSIQETRDFCRGNLQRKVPPAGNDVNEKNLGGQLPVPYVKLVVGNIPLDGNFVP